MNNLSLVGELLFVFAEQWTKEALFWTVYHCIGLWYRVTSDVLLLNKIFFYIRQMYFTEIRGSLMLKGN